MIEYVKFEDWLKEQVIDAEYLLPEAKKAFRENYEKLKAEGNLPKAKQAEKDTKYELEKFQNQPGNLWQNTGKNKKAEKTKGFPKIFPN